MRSSEVGSSEAAPARVIPRFGQIGHDKSESGSKESWDVLHDDDSRSKYANDAGKLEPQSRTCAVSESSTEASVGDILARKPAGEHIDPRESGVNLSHIGGNRDGRPVTVEDGLAVLVVLARPREVEPGVVEAEVESAAP